MTKKRRLEDLYRFYQSIPLVKPLLGQNNIEQELPFHPIDRCHQRWIDLFFGVWRVLYQHDPNLVHGLLESMRNQGLLDDDFLSGNLFSIDPPDEVLKGVRTFRATAAIPKLRGKVPPWKRYDPIHALFDFQLALRTVSKLTRRPRNPSSKFLTLKERLPEILSKMRFTKRKNVPDLLLRQWVNGNLPPKELTTRLVAHIHGFTPVSFRKYLARARRENPDLAHILRHGIGTD